ncbi:tRNA (guanine-N(7)-)-methyltransferase non-catalytic subunit trm82 [Aspergillus melleus]|uniref:tRNA (Guanine-N(7)-)-methyltransferase non-catalytic subunit trm82 n=1 Tax=Aspergillus melleus TaxID=138277 RepID=A0ACC3B6N3_9EURO|nr:tRNA (guanine-N(7)-)-methyltransferase non-catalytic subunit trm82 [Aspergillus melleus]
MVAILQHPFLRLQFVDRQHVGRQNIIVGSAGSKLYSYAAETGQRLASWPQAEDQSNVENQGPPEKKRKLSATDETAAEQPTSTNGASAKPKTPSWTSIPLVVASSTGEHVVAMTLEDKCVRVFQLGEDGSFQQLSERVMPKRGCALSLVSNDSLILLGDKFGDVYSLPLIPGDEEIAAPKVAARKMKHNWPAATNLTVHTKGNLASLEQQKLQYDAKMKKLSEDGPSLKFEHQLLVGHVSLLTDLAFVSLPVDASGDKKRSYILTADRDEHIRVSRGPPQTHVVENQCLGHTSFITKLCVPTWAPEYLVSGGGDNYLLVWKWAEGHILQKVPLVDETSETSESAPIAVRGIWATSFDALRLILVAIEGSTQLRCFVQESDGMLKEQQSFSASGNILDVTTNEKEKTVIVCVDNVREAGSTQEWRASPATTLVEAYRAKPEGESLTWEPVTNSTISNINSSGTTDLEAIADAKKRKEANDSLYGLGNLRKKHMGEDD